LYSNGEELQNSLIGNVDIKLLQKKSLALIIGKAL